MIGIIVNTLAVIIGGGLGCMLTGKMPTRVQRLILQMVGAVALFLGARSFLGGWFSDTSTAKETTGTLLVIFALLVGGVFGEAFRLDKLLDALGRALGRFIGMDAAAPAHDTGAKNTAVPQSQPNRKEAIKQAKQATSHHPAKGTKNRTQQGQASPRPVYPAVEPRSGSRFADGFVWATLLCALSALSFSGVMSVVHTGEPKDLFIKAAIDAVLVFALAAVYGMGATFGALPILVVEGILLFVGNQWTTLMTPTLVSHLTVIAAVISLGAGVCLAFDKKWRVVNLLPAFFISPIYGLIVKLAEKAIEK